MIPILEGIPEAPVFHEAHQKTLIKTERKFLKGILISCLHKFFCNLFYKNFQFDLGKNFKLTTECYTMDEKIIQILIREIVETGEYTLEGIATYTGIPIDIIIDVACGSMSQFSITLWIRIIDLYMQVKPEISKFFFVRLIETIEKDHFNLSHLLA